MNLKKLTSWVFLGILGCLCFPACQKDGSWKDPTGREENPLSENVRLDIRSRLYLSKAMTPEDQAINDLNLFIFNGEGILEQHLFLDRHQLGHDGDKVSYPLKLLKSVFYHIKAVANVGWKIKGIQDMEDLNHFRYYLAYPDDYRFGTPMAGTFEGELPTPKEGSREIILQLELERVLAKISVSLDRSKLEPGVKLRVTRIAIRQCPKSVCLFQESEAMNEQDVFSTGYCLENSEANPLNQEASPGVSKEVDLYMLENRQGNLLPEAVSAQEKILGSHPRAKVASYVEMFIDYQSDSFMSGPGEHLIYRFYLGEGPKNFSIEKNAHYHYVIQPAGDGLRETSWRVDKSHLGSLRESPLQIRPSDYIEARVGDTIHVWAELEDGAAQLDIGMEELEYERERGMFNYQIDKNGKGVHLHLLKKGTAILYMSSGAYSAMAVIHIRL